MSTPTRLTNRDLGTNVQVRTPRGLLITVELSGFDNARQIAVVWLPNAAQAISVPYRRLRLLAQSEPA